jgi:hypothetical protein
MPRARASTTETARVPLADLIILPVYEKISPLASPQRNWFDCEAFYHTKRAAFRQVLDMTDFNPSLSKRC